VFGNLNDKTKSTTFRITVWLNFEAMRIKDLKKKFHDELRGIYDEREIKSMFSVLAGEYLGLSSVELTIHAGELVSKKEIDQFDAALLNMKDHVPVQYILGQAEFMDFNLQVGPGVLIPRPETEELIQMLIDNVQVPSDRIRILDIGTGTGCIPIALSKHIKNAELIAVEQSEIALKYARNNIKINHARVDLHQMDFLDESSWNKLGKFDIIISNPPYVTNADTSMMRKNVLDHEPHDALFVDDQLPLFFYQQIIRFSKDYLSDDGWIYLEINEKYGKELLDLFNGNAFRNVSLYQDLSGKDRFVKAGEQLL